MRACGLSGYRTDGDFSIERQLRDVLSSPIMINNDRILASLATHVADGARCRARRATDRKAVHASSNSRDPRHESDAARSDLDSAVPPAGRRRGLRAAARSTRRSWTDSRRTSRACATRGAEVMRFPPVMSRAQLEKSGYLKSFPNLLGCVCALHGTRGGDPRRGGRDSRPAATGPTRSSPADLVLSPAACYPVYPIAAARGRAARRAAGCSTSRRTASATSPRAPRPAAVVPHARVRPHRHARGDPGVSRAAGWRARRELADELGAAMQDRRRQRPVLRPRRPDAWPSASDSSR